MKGSFFSTRNIAYLAILLALVIVLQTFGGAINIGAVQLNFTLVPIVLGAIILGPLAGAFLGLACGIVVLVQVIMGLVPFYTLIWTGAPVQTFFTCTVKTTLAGFLAGLVFKAFRKKNALIGVFVAAAIVPIVNTAVFVLGCITMWNVIAEMAGGTNVLGFILVSLVTFNFFIELGVNLLVSPGVYRVVKIFDKSLGRKQANSVDYEKGSDSDQIKTDDGNKAE